MEKNVSISIHLDFYGKLLSDRKNEIMDYYYNDDLSLAEIAEIIGISRQGVRDIIKRCEKELFYMEERLGMIARFEKTAKNIAEIKKIAHKIDFEAKNNKEIHKSASDIIRIADSIEE
ncbi:MAG: putative DNA-binding protein [Bacillota bacterium]|nr:putative DNA-binding protein [Bacillota bacterium]